MNLNRGFILTCLALIVLLATFFSGFAFGTKRTRQIAVDNNAGNYVLTDSYGTVEWRWTASAPVQDTKALASR